MEDGMSIELLEDRLSRNPKSLLFARLAEIYIKQGRIDDAIELCLAGTQYHPSYITGMYILARAYAANNDHESAEASLKKVLAHDRKHLSSQKMLGDLMMRNGWENKAAIHYRDILDTDPMLDEVRSMLSRLTDSRPESEAVPSSPPLQGMGTQPDLLQLPDESGPDESDLWRDQFDEIFPQESEAEGSGPELRDDEPMLPPESYSISIRESDRAPEPDESEQDIIINDLLFDEPEQEMTDDSPPVSEISNDVNDLTDELDGLLTEMEEKPESNVPESETDISESEPVSGFSPHNLKDLGEELEEITQSSVEAGDVSFSADSERIEKTDSDGCTIEALAEELDNIKLSLNDKPDPAEENEPDTEQDFESFEEFELDNKPVLSTDETVNPETAKPAISVGSLTDPLDNQSTPHETESSDKLIRDIPAVEKNAEQRALPESRKRKMVSPTLGEIYAAQGQYAKAIGVYEQLHQKQPENPKHLTKIAELKKKLEASKE